MNFRLDKDPLFRENNTIKVAVNCKIHKLLNQNQKNNLNYDMPFSLAINIKEIPEKGNLSGNLYAMPDHIHIFIGYYPSQPLPDLHRDIKANTSRFINEKKWMPGKFQWQEGYGAFSYSHSQINDVIQYINSQEEHHRMTSFREEYLKLLEKFDIEYDPKYLFEWI